MIDWGAGIYELTATQLAPAAERAVEAAGVLPGERVLDVACGTGNAALLAAMRGAAVTGVDLAPRLLEVAAGRARAAGVEVDWRAGDATALPFADDAFDVALSVYGVIFAPPEQAAAELLRVTAPGGRIVLTTWTGEGTLVEATGVLRRAMAAAAGVTLPAPGDAAAASAPAQAPAGPDWGAPEDLRALLAPTGAGLTVERYAHAFAADSAEAFADAWMDAHPLWLAGREVLGEQAYAALREPLLAALGDGDGGPGGFRVSGVALLVVAQLP